MARLQQDVTEAELGVLRLLWERGAPTTIRELTDELYPEGSTAHYATVQKLLERLETKGFVERSRRQRVNVYEATMARDELIARRLRHTAEQLCEGSLSPLLTQLVGGTRLSSQELATLERLVERLDRKRRRS